MKNAFVLLALALAVVLGYLSPAEASNRQGLLGRRQQQNAGHVQQQRVVNRQRVRAVHHNQAQQVQAVYVPVQQVRVEKVYVPAQQLNGGCHNDNAGVLQFNGGGCSALYQGR